MTTLSSNAPAGSAGGFTRTLRGLLDPWRAAVDVRDHAYGADQSAGLKLGLLAGVLLLGLLAGAAVAVAGVNAFYLTVAAIGCGFILLDFRVGVVLLILLMPVSRSYVFPHAMFGVTGANPLNLLMAATLGSFLLHAVSGGGWRRFVPAPLLWLYVVPIVVAGMIGMRHIGEIAPAFYLTDPLTFDSAGGYLRETVFKPLTIIVFALLVGAAVARSEKPEKFLAPTLISIWIMSALTIVFVARSGISLGLLASDNSREFFAPLGLHANDLGRLYTVAYALLLFTWAEAKERGLKLVLAASMALAALALMLTFSRSAFLGFVVVNGLFMLWRLNVRTVFFVGLLAVGLLLLPVAVYERVGSGFGYGLNAITAGRIDGLWLPLLPEVLKSPLFGSGHNSILWSEAMRLGGGSSVLLVTHPHNAYLQALLDMGVIGLVLLCAYFVHVYRRARALSRDPELSSTMRGFYAGTAAGLVGLLAVGIADGGLTPRSEQAFLWLAIGMMYGQYSAQKKPAG